MRAIQYPSAISAMVAAFVGREPKVTEMLSKRIESSDPVVVRVGDEDVELKGIVLPIVFNFCTGLRGTSPGAPQIIARASGALGLRSAATCFSFRGWNGIQGATQGRPAPGKEIRKRS